MANEVAAELLRRRNEAFVGAIRAIVSYVDNDRGYIAAYPENRALTADKSITLSKQCWLGSDVPRNGQVIELARVEEFGTGWRAQLGRPVELKT